MSAAAEFTPALQYLTDGAHLLQTTAPETAAHLMSQRGELMWKHDVALSDVQRQHICGACGNIMIPGVSSALKLDARRPRHAPKQTETRRTKCLSKSIQCKRCDKTTRTKIDPIPRSKIARSKSSRDIASSRPSVAAESSQANAPPKPATAQAQSNQSSKKRAKNRKAGLQALLAGQAQQKSNSLSLADFRAK